ncbi:MAG: hypothetical protein H0V82_06730 [Candidatus Protochlamydia sp.]|nr:hypothetical protein [Candidatus Protochlamydia sp.]
MKKKICLIILFLFFLLGGVFYQTIHLAVVKWALQAYSVKSFGHPLEYAALHYENGFYVLKKPRLEEDFSAEEIAFQYQLSGWQELNVSLIFENPSLKLKEKVKREWEKWEKWESLIEKGKSWFTVRPNIKINHGRLFAPSQDTFPECLYFDLSYNNDNGGYLHLFFDEDRNSNSIVLEGVSGQAEMRLRLKCRRVNACSLLAVARSLYPRLTSWKLSEGVLDGEIEGIFKPHARPFLQGELQVGQLVFSHPKKHLNGYLPQARLKLEKNIFFDQEPGQSTTVGELTIQKPAFLFFENEQDITWKMNDIEGRIAINTSKKAVLDLKAQGTFLGKTSDFKLEGEANLSAQKGLDLNLDLLCSSQSCPNGKIHLEWGQNKEFLTVELDGEVKDFINYFPATFQDMFKEQFYNHHINALSHIKNQAGQFELNGALKIWQGPESAPYFIHFGGELQKKGLPYGWFYTHSLPIKSFISPLIFPKKNVRMNGLAKLKGVLDDHLITLHYEADDFTIENEDFLISAKELHSAVPGRLLGWHQFNLKNGEQYGTLPVQNASYLEKHSGLCFDSIQGKIFFKESSMQLQSMEAYCEEVYFSGSLDLEYSDPNPEVFCLKVQSPFFLGKISKIRSILSKFNPAFSLSQFPLEGELTGREGGLSLVLNFMPDNHHLEASVQGSLLNGELSFGSHDVSLKGIFLDLDYQHPARCLTLTDIQGVLLIEKSRLGHELEFGGSRICLSTLDKSKFDIDCWVKNDDKQNEILHLTASAEEKERGEIDVAVNSNSHFNGIGPGISHFILNQEGSVHALNFQTEFDWKEQISRLKGTKAASLMNFPAGFLDSIGLLEGKVRLSGSYDPLEKEFNFQLASPCMATSEMKFENCLLKASKRGKRWIIDQCGFGQTHLFADLQELDDSWKINFLGLNVDSFLVLGLEGSVEPAKGIVDAKINLCEIDLNKGEEYSALKPIIGELKLLGKIQASGRVRVTDFFKPAQHLEGEFGMEFNGLAIGDYKKDGLFEGKCNFKYATQKFEMNLALQDGIYVFKKKPYDLKYFNLNIFNNFIHFSALTNYEKYPYKVDGMAAWPALDKGEYTFSESTNPLNPLKIEWYYDPIKGNRVERAKGAFCGIALDLNFKEMEKGFYGWNALEGTVQIDLRRAFPILSSYIKEGIQKIGLDSHFQLKGSFWMNQEAGDLMESLSMRGQLSSLEGRFKGYFYDYLTAGVDFRPGRLDFSHFNITDKAGSVEIPELTFLENTRHEWQIFMPKFLVKNLRPYRLRKEISGSVFPKYKSLVIKKLEIDDFYGLLNNTQTWSGSGQLQFLNSVKKTPSHPLFAIPAEIILRVGLDPQVLNPITGTINFKLAGDRFILTRFKDVYSGGRGSKFYLAKSLEPSWVDTEGNLSLQIRMKQYNLLFKIAELLTVSVKGNFNKPEFKLQKQGSRK